MELMDTDGIWTSSIRQRGKIWYEIVLLYNLKAVASITWPKVFLLFK
jgi:hypothetical protein